MLPGDDRPKSKEILVINPTLKESRDAKTSLSKLLNANKDERILVVYIFAGHGLDAFGAVSMIVNEMDKPKNWYNLFAAESFVKD